MIKFGTIISGLAQDKDFLNLLIMINELVMHLVLVFLILRKKWKAKICNGVNSIKYLSVREKSRVLK